jgi:hypothetical protein
MPANAAKLRIRPIADADADNVVDLLVEGFPRRHRLYWVEALSRLENLDRPAAAPKFGYLLEDSGVPVGVMLVITHSDQPAGGQASRANLSSWYVRPDYRSYAALLLSRACREKDVTYLNVSAAANTYSICEAIGFKRYSQGQIGWVPLLSRPSAGLSIVTYDSGAQGLDVAERRILDDHAAYGCECLIGVGDGVPLPFVFLRRRIKSWLPAIQLVYCRSMQDVVRYARPLGRFLARRGVFLVLLDASGPIPGLSGKYFHGRSPKYYKGPEMPRLCDLAYTEIPLFGM